MFRRSALVLSLSIGLLAILTASGHTTSHTPAHPGQGLVDLMLEYLEVRYPGCDVSGDVLYVSVQRQMVYHVRAGLFQQAYPIATAAMGLDTRLNTNGTPTGLHRICAKIGDDVPAFGVLSERRFTGQVVQPIDSAAKDDLITSRILWLDGLEPGHNKGGECDSRKRFIYIHGTADEGNIGRPSSHGCIRMRNADVIALYAQVPIDALVVILDN